MKVSGTSGTGSSTGAKPARGAGGEGFRLNMPAAASGAATVSGASALGGIMGLDALLALQDVGSPLERRRRAVGRAGRILDELDEMRLALIGGDGVSAHNLDRLRRAVRDQRDGTDDARLEQVLDEVELRAAVEIAKLEQSSRAA